VQWLSVIVGALLALILGTALLQHTIAEHTLSRTAPRHRLALHQGLSSLPLAAQGVISATLAADDPTYRITASGGGFQAQSPRQHLRMRFENAGVQIGSGKTQVSLSLRAAGYGTSLHAVDDARPSAQANRVTYRHAGLSEWYRNGPLGLEQGFTVPRVPSGHPAGALTLSMALSGNAHASLAPGEKSITFSHPDGPSLRYGGLTATDASGRVLHSWLALYRGTLMLKVDTLGARYPLRIDPFIQQGEKLTSSEPSGDLGWSVALSADGNTALVGARLSEWDTANPRGAAWVFTRSGETWTQQGEKLEDGEPGYTEFGFSVALSADGDTALIGGPAHANNAGAAWVFTRTGSTWAKTETFTGPGGELDQFGESVALSADGNTALVGAPADYREGAGTAWVFTRSGSSWTQQGEPLTGRDGGEFGSSVALSGNGDTALVGEFAEGHGAAWVFTRAGETWMQPGEQLTGTGEAPYVGYPGPCREQFPGSGCESSESEFGWSVALSSNGSTALIGGRGDNGGLGAAWMFARSDESWIQQGEKLTDEDGGEFGYSVALSGDGSTALVSAPFSGSGSAFVFTRSGEAWKQRERLTGSGQNVGDLSGLGVALSADGTTAMLGAPQNDDYEGAVWAFTEEPPTTPTVVTEPPSTLTHTSATLNATVNPNGSDVTECEFEYGTSTSYGSNTPCSSLPGEGNSPVAVSAPAEGLNESTTYHFRIVATNSAGTSYGSDARFTTLGPPDFGRCVEVPAEKEGKKTVYHGGFTAATCLVASAGKTGKYEWEPGVTKAGFTMSLAEGAVTLETIKKVKVTCATGAGAGQYSGTKEVADVVLKFTGCESSGHKCATAGLAEGELQTKTLEGELGWEAKPAKKVALDLYPNGKAGAFMEYRCTGEVPITVTGSILVPVTAGKMLLTSTLKYKASKGKQVPEHFEDEPSDVLTASLNGEIFEQLGQTASLTQTNEEAVEINTAV
jgi:hypothetical protein